VLAAFYALVRGRQRARDYVAEYEVGRRLSRERAIDRLIARYLRGAGFSSPRLLARLFALPRADVEAAIGPRARRGAVSYPMAIAGRRGAFVVSVE
jgi:hypothetical protein